MDDELREALRRLDRAIADPGRMPDYHRSQVRRVRTEWPTLWRAIDDLRQIIRAEDGRR